MKKEIYVYTKECCLI